MPFGPTHTAIKALARWAISSFYQEILVLDSDNVPAEPSEPLIVCCNHWNMTVDPAVLSCWFPHGRKLHYWAKDTLFANPVANVILRDAGNIPVDRKTGNNKLLSAGTFDVLKLGECVAIFPEGTSYTEPGIRTMKDGASWAALQYGKHIRELAAKDPSIKYKDVKICIVGLTYTEKSKYRSRVVMELNELIDVGPYAEEFLVEEKTAAKKLTERIRHELTNVTLNADDWDTLNMSKLARRILWTHDDNIPLQDFRLVAQTLVNLFESKDPKKAVPVELKELLRLYGKTLQKAKLSSSSLGPVTLPRSLDPAETVPIPTRVSTLFSLLYSSLWSLCLLPSFFFPLIAHLPTYFAGKSAFYLINSDEEECFAQNKIVMGLFFLMFIIYPTLFFAFWAFCTTASANLTSSGLGALMALLLVVLFAIYHNRSIDSNYRAAKRLVACWRVLVGVWTNDVSIHDALQLRQRVSKELQIYLRNLSAIEEQELENSEEGDVAFLKSRGARIGRYKSSAENQDDIHHIIHSSSE